MDEEQQFVSIDLNDDNICSVCKLETETGTLSFCHICFELSIEGVSSAVLLHSKSLRGHRDCFEKCHLIANQKLSHSKVSRNAYEGMKQALGKKLNRIIQYAQNKEPSPSQGLGSRRSARLLCYNQQGDCKLLPQSDTQVPRYTPCWDRTKVTDLPEYTRRMLECHTAEELGLRRESNGGVWPSDDRKNRNQTSVGQKHPRGRGHSRDELTKMSMDELHQLNTELLMQLQKVFEELTAVVQEKDALASELHVRHIAIEQLFKNCAKLPWLHISQAGVKSSSSSSNGISGSSSGSSGPLE